MEHFWTLYCDLADGKFLVKGVRAGGGGGRERAGLVHSLKLMNYLPVQVDKPDGITYLELKISDFPNDYANLQ